MPENEDAKKQLALQYLNTMTRDPDLVELATGWTQTFAFKSEDKAAPSKKRFQIPQEILTHNISSKCKKLGPNY